MPEAASIMPTMSDELKKNLNMHFGLNIKGVRNPPIIGNRINRLGAVGTQGS